jgi:acyl-coenzyme A synthetase/AMP-(fatty) acid ligase
MQAHFALNLITVIQIDGATGETDTYYNLLRKCIRISINLLTRGITKDDIICLCTSNHFNSCIPIISGLFLGVKVAPLDPSLSLDDTTYILNQIRPRLIFVSTDVIEMIEEALEDVGVECEIVVFGFCYGFTEIEEFLEPVKNEAKFKPLPVTDITETAIILFSSGTAGPSKGICLSHQALMTQFINTISYWNLGQKIYYSNYTEERSETGLMTAINFATYQWMPAIALLCCSILTATARIICKTFESEVVWKLIDKYEVSKILYCYEKIISISFVLISHEDFVYDLYFI